MCLIPLRLSLPLFFHRGMLVILVDGVKASWSFLCYSHFLSHSLWFFALSFFCAWALHRHFEFDVHIWNNFFFATATEECELFSLILLWMSNWTDGEMWCDVIVLWVRVSIIELRPTIAAVASAHSSCCKSVKFFGFILAKYAKRRSHASPSVWMLTFTQ